MIELIVEDYCQDCSDFEPVARKGFGAGAYGIYADNKVILHDTIVTCERYHQCKRVQKWCRKKFNSERCQDGEPQS